MRLLPLAAVLLLLLGGCGSSDSPDDDDDGGQPPPAVEPALPEFPPLPSTPAWLEGDLHVHNDHSSDGSLPRQISDDQLPGNVSVADQIGLAERRGLGFLPLTDHRSYDQHYDPLWRSAALLLIPGEEANGSPHATVQGAVDSIVQGENPEGAPPRRRLQQSVWDAHAQDANWTTAHPDDGEVGEDGLPNDLADAVGVDLIEVWNKASDVEAEIDYAENRWNAGFRTGIAGASDSHFRELWLVAGPGQPRSAAYAPAASERGLVGALRAGRTRLRADAQAPLLEFSAVTAQATALPGDELVAAAGTAVELRIEVQNAAGASVRIYGSPGRSAGPLQEFPVGLVATAASWSLPVSVGEAPAWYRVELRGLGAPQAISFDALSDDPLQFLQQLSLVDQLLALSAPVFVSTAPAVAQPASPLPADAGLADDGAALVLGRQGSFVGFPDLASADGALHLVAEAHDAASSRIVYRRRDARGRWSEPLLLSGDDTAARFPRIAAQGDAVWAVWQDSSAREQPRRPRIVLRESRDGGASWQPATLLRTLDGRAEHPALVLDRAGRPVVAWQEMADGQAFEIAVQAVGVDSAPLLPSREGKQIRAATAFDTRSARYPASVWPALALSPQGEIALAWQDNRHDAEPLFTGATGSGEGSDPDDWQIAICRRAADAAVWSAASFVGAADRADRHPSVAYDGAGRLVAAWDSKLLRSSGANLAVQAARSDDGVNWSAPAAVFEDPAAMSQYPRLVRDGDGSVRAAWYDGRSADWRWRIAEARLGHDGGWHDGRLIQSRGNSSWPAPAADTLAFASTRAAQRLQRDSTQGIAVIEH